MNKKTLNSKFLSVMLAGACMSLGANAQSVRVKGHVQDKSGEPVVFATVSVPGTKTMTQTDANGNFTINVAAGSNLRVAYIGYKTATVKADGTMTIVLEDNSTLNEAVVVGYAKVKKTDATGSVTAIKPDEMTKGITTNAQDMLVGKVAGVDVATGGGTPGAGASIRIRGGSSLNASNDPLIVIDGLAMDNEGVKGLSNPLAMVNPEDIASFTVLKDASATAIYGSRASNGVIIITTKKGRKNSRPQVTYNGSVSVGTKAKTYDVMSGDEYRNYVKQTFGDAATLPLGNANTDWQDQIYQTAISHDHNVSINGGLGWLPYRLSFGYTNEEGIIKTSSFERYTVAVNLAPTFFNDHLSVNLNAKFMSAKNRYADGGAIGAALSMDPTQPVYFDANDPYAQFTGGYYQHMTPASFSDPNWTAQPNTKNTANPLAMLELKNHHSKSQSVIGNLELDYKIHGLEDVHIHANVGGDYSEGNEWNIISPYSASNNYFGNNWRDVKYKYNLQGNIYAQYQHIFGYHNVDIMAGTEAQHFHNNGYGEGGGWDPYTKEDKDYQGRATTAYATRNSLLSYFGRLNYIYNDRYLATFTMRWDGSSRFADGNRWGTFPSLALGWKIKNEKFLRTADWLSDLKLRLGWGITGQQNIGMDFYYTPLYSVGDDYAQYPIGGDYLHTQRPNAFNKDLTWEKTTTWNAGLDFAFLNNRIDGSVDYYYRETKDLISTVDVEAGTNFNNQITKNIGKLKNYGLEFTLNARPVQTRDFTWQITYNAMWNRNKITELYGDAGYVATGISPSKLPAGGTVQVNKVGYPANSFYVYQQVYDENGKPIENMFVDRNGNGYIDDGDRYIYKKPTADILMGFTSKFIYKNWDFSFTLRASLNNYVYYDYLCDRSDVSLSGMTVQNEWTNRTMEHINLGWSGQGNYALSDYFVRNASFLRCDNITLGYSFRNLFKANKYEGISGRVYFLVQNPFVITKYDGLDPEISNADYKGIDKSFYPRPRTFMLGLNLNF